MTIYREVSFSISNAYKGITLLNVIGKIFERLVLQRWLPVFETCSVPNPLQFAYQKNSYCRNASLLLQEAVAQNVERGSNIYCCFPDFAKGFDTVWTEGLFFKLYNNRMNGKSWPLLHNRNKRQTSIVRANGLISEKFPLQEGVCQAGVLSPWLFLCFNNDIPQILTKHCSMLTVNSIPCNPVMVADDIIILSTRVKGLQEQHDTLESYSCRDGDSTLTQARPLQLHLEKPPGHST